MKNLIAALTACLAFAALVSGCGSEEEEPSASEVDTATQEEPTAANREPADKAVEVSMKDILFKPESVTVKSGGAVQWTNDDPFEHTVTYESGPGEKFDSKTVAGGDTFEQTFTKAGTVKYICTIHPQQKGDVIVE